jgi:hypothetical protein
MLVAVNGFGSIWTRRYGKNPDSPTRFTRDAVYYNTTGVPVNGKMRTRSRVYGVARFNGASGFTPHHPEKTLHRVFECPEPGTWNGGNRVLFGGLTAEQGPPDCYLVTIQTSMTGWIDREQGWKASECFLISFSESDLDQEAMLLMPAFSWVRGTAGVFVLKPEAKKTGCARLIATRKDDSVCATAREASK